MFQRFTERARQVVVLAQDEARSFGHDFIGSEHLLLGLIRERDGAATRALAALGLTIDVVRAEVERLNGRGESPPTGQIPFRPPAKQALEGALAASLALGDPEVDTEHLLLGIAAVERGGAAELLQGHHLDSERVRDEVLRARDA